VLTYPIYEYPSTGAECSITGGVVYHGSQFPYLQGQYFFGDYCSGKVWSILVNGGAVVDTTNHTGQISPSLDGFIINQLVGIGEDNDGELYLLDRGSTVTPTGSVFKVVKDPDFVGVDIGTPAPGAAALELSRVNPNPFRNSTSFDVQLSRDGNLEVGVYTASGQLLRRIHSGSMTAGRHSLLGTASNERSIPRSGRRVLHSRGRAGIFRDEARDAAALASAIPCFLTVEEGALRVPSFFLSPGHSRMRSNFVTAFLANNSRRGISVVVATLLLTCAMPASAQVFHSKESALRLAFSEAGLRRAA
jgi:hypothetical protein